MTDDNGWRVFFDKFAPQYMDEEFTGNTVAEVDFIVEEFGLPEGSSFLDVGCGTGRHSLELARRGYEVTGLDISENMLQEGRNIAREEGLDVDFIHADAVDFTMEKSFDGCICLCEGAFGLLSIDEDPFERDRKILQNVHSVLEPDAKFMLNALNGLKMIRESEEEDVEAGRFDPVGIVKVHSLSDLLDDAPDDVMIKEKGFLATELRQMFERVGFDVEHIWGGTAGSWNRQRLKMDEMELMVIGKKRAR